MLAVRAAGGPRLASRSFFRSKEIGWNRGFLCKRWARVRSPERSKERFGPYSVPTGLDCPIEGASLRSESKQCGDLTLLDDLRSILVPEDVPKDAWHSFLLEGF